MNSCGVFGMLEALGVCHVDVEERHSPSSACAPPSCTTSTKGTLRFIHARQSLFNSADTILPIQVTPPSF
jgi:hypothetical protein